MNESSGEVLCNKNQNSQTIRNDSTECSNEGEGSEQKYDTKVNLKYRLTLKRNIRIESEEEQIAVLCLQNLLKR